MAADPVPQVSIDVSAYCRRIGYQGELAPRVSVLRALHEAHVGAIPFENIDVLLERPILLDTASLQHKLVADRRGGYCFEHNLLFKDVLEAIGFRVLPLAARVRFDTTVVRPRTHMTLLVEAEGQRYLADTGFGAQGLLEPIRFECGVISELPLVAFRLAEGNGLWILQSVLNGQWSDLYAFTLEPQERIDYVMGSHFTATFPDSIFRKTLTAQIVRRHERKLLRQGVLKIIRADGEQVQTVRTDRDTRAVLSGHFGIKLPSDCVLPARIFEPLSQ